MKTVRVVVVGAGVIGFSTAVCVAEALPFCSVTVLAEKFSPDTTSDGAAGILFAAQFPDISVERQRRWFKDSFDHLRAIAQSQQSPEAGVMMSSGYQIFKDVPADPKPYWSDLVIGFRLMTDRELERFPGYKFGQAFTTVKCECSSYLPWLEKRLFNIYFHTLTAFFQTVPVTWQDHGWFKNPEKSLICIFIFLLLIETTAVVFFSVRVEQPQKGSVTHLLRLSRCLSHCHFCAAALFPSLQTHRLVLP
uniref:D-aspartate oxidase n=1 Tax=Sphaeramia orbicularis TaxID=375764 RepID=A0A673BMQ6_9TELE